MFSNKNHKNKKSRSGYITQIMIAIVLVGGFITIFSRVFDNLGTLFLEGEEIFNYRFKHLEVIKDESNIYGPIPDRPYRMFSSNDFTCGDKTRRFVEVNEFDSNGGYYATVVDECHFKDIDQFASKMIDVAGEEKDAYKIVDIVQKREMYYEKGSTMSEDKMIIEQYLVVYWEDGRVKELFKNMHQEKYGRKNNFFPTDLHTIPGLGVQNSTIEFFLYGMWIDTLNDPITEKTKFLDSRWITNMAIPKFFNWMHDIAQQKSFKKHIPFKYTHQIREGDFTGYAWGRMLKATYKNDKLDGAVEHYEGNIVEDKSWFRDNYGIWYYNDKNKDIETYKNGKRDGKYLIFERWKNSDTPIVDMTYKDGKPVGKFIIYDFHRKEGTFEGSKLSLTNYYLPDGLIANEATYVNGLREGPQINYFNQKKYYVDGVGIASIDNYKLGLKDGVQKTYDLIYGKKGSDKKFSGRYLREEEFYKSGELTNSIKYNENGSIQSKYTPEQIEKENEKQKRKDTEKTHRYRAGDIPAKIIPNLEYLQEGSLSNVLSKKYDCAKGYYSKSEFNMCRIFSTSYYLDKGAYKVNCEQSFENLVNNKKLDAVFKDTYLDSCTGTNKYYEPLHWNKVFEAYMDKLFDGSK